MGHGNSDQVEDRPFPPGVEMTDWAGISWQELAPERVKYIEDRARVFTKSRKEMAKKFLAEIPVGQGRTRRGLPDLKTAERIRSVLYEAAHNVWSTVDAKGVNHSNIKALIEYDKPSDTYSVEFVHLAPKTE